MPATTMKALRKTQPGKGLRLEKLAVPTIGPTDVLVRVKASSICGTDLHIYGWDHWSQGRIKPPVTLGHEFCGVVERAGQEVTAVKGGDFVSAEMHLNCGHCHQCRLGQAHICQNLRIIGIDIDGAFAEFVKIPATNIWKLDAAIPEHYAAILDPLGNAAHRPGRTNCRVNRAGHWVRPDWIDVHRCCQGVRKFHGFCHRDERPPSDHGQRNGRGFCPKPRGRRSGKENP